MSVVKRGRGHSLSLSEYPRMSNANGLGKVSLSGRSGRKPIGRARISDSIRRRRSGSASGSTTMRISKPRRRLIGGVNQAKLAKIITVTAFVAVGAIGLVLILMSANSGTRELEMSVIDNADSTSVITAEDTDSTITLALAGGIKLQDEIISAARSGDGYNFDNYLSELKSVMSADISVVGLMGSVDGNGGNAGIAGYPAANYPLQLIGALSNVGVNCAATANRGALSLGYDSMAKTHANLTANGIMPIGTYLSADTGNTVYIRKLNSISVGIGAYCCLNDGDLKSLQNAQTNAGVTGEQMSYCINQTSYSKSREENGKSYSDASDVIKKDVQAMREAGAQFIVIYLDWGSAGTTTPPSEMTDLAQRMIDMGVDVTVGCGVDVPMKVTVKEYSDSNGNKKDCYVFYSLGNLFSDTGDNSIQKRESMVVSFELERFADENNITVNSAKYYPIYISRDAQYESENTYLKYHVVPTAAYSDADTRPAIFSSDNEWTRCKNAGASIRSIIQTNESAAKKLSPGAIKKEGVTVADNTGANANI